MGTLDFNPLGSIWPFFVVGRPLLQVFMLTTIISAPKFVRSFDKNLENPVSWLRTRCLIPTASCTRPTKTKVPVLRRLVARRIHLEQRRLTLEETKNEQALEKLFWEWTQRPDIRAQHYPHQDPDKMRNDVVRLLERHLLGVRDQANHASEPDPAALHQTANQSWIKVQSKLNSA